MLARSCRHDLSNLELTMNDNVMTRALEIKSGPSCFVQGKARNV